MTYKPALYVHKRSFRVWGPMPSDDEGIEAFQHALTDDVNTKRYFGDDGSFHIATTHCYLPDSWDMSEGQYLVEVSDGAFVPVSAEQLFEGYRPMHCTAIDDGGECHELALQWRSICATHHGGVR